MMPAWPHELITTSPTVADPKAGSVFVPMLIGHRIPGEFFGGEMVIYVGVGVAAKPVPDFVFYPGVWQYAFDRLSVRDKDMPW